MLDMDWFLTLIHMTSSRVAFAVACILGAARIPNSHSYRFQLLFGAPLQ